MVHHKNFIRISSGYVSGHKKAKKVNPVAGDFRIFFQNLFSPLKDKFFALPAWEKFAAKVASLHFLHAPAYERMQTSKDEAGR